MRTGTVTLDGGVWRLLAQYLGCRTRRLPLPLIAFRLSPALDFLADLRGHGRVGLRVGFGVVIHGGFIPLSGWDGQRRVEYLGLSAANKLIEVNTLYASEVLSHAHMRRYRCVKPYLEARNSESKSTTCVVEKTKPS